MWCPNCKADVAAEVAADNRRVRCATCGSEISAAGTTAFSKTREARDLLDRWATQRKGDGTVTRASLLEEKPEPRRLAPRGAGGVSLEPEISHQPAERPKTSLRFDTSHATMAPALDSVRAQTASSAVAIPERVAVAPPVEIPPIAAPRSEPTRLHAHHEYPPASPHFSVQSNLLETERRSANWSSVIGQLIAYAGVALLTIGSSLVLWSYFGGPASYAPTGWLTTTAGQMLLFLGVVTLVSGGMEQTNEEVKTRIERLGDRLLRIEQITRDHALRGPSISAEYYGANPPTRDEVAGQAEIRR